jgi:hypothetical protein
LKNIEKFKTLREINDITAFLCPLPNSVTTYIIAAGHSAMFINTGAVSVMVLYYLEPESIL